MRKLLDILTLFRKGSAVAEPGVWKDASNLATLLVPLIVAVTKVAGDFGYGQPIDTASATAIAGGVVAAIQFVCHNVSSDKAGVLPAKRETPAEPNVAPARNDGQ